MKFSARWQCDTMSPGLSPRRRRNSEFHPAWRQQLFRHHFEYLDLFLSHTRWPSLRGSRATRQISFTLLHFILILIFVVSFAAGEGKRQPFLEPQLTEDELRLVFGARSTVPEYELVVPTLSSGGTRWTRSVSDASSARQQQLLADSRRRSSDPLHISLDALGHKFTFRLEESRGLVSPTAALVHRFHNHTELQSLVEKRNCLYTGHQHNTTIAVSICSHMRGVIRSPTEELIIEPLPASARRRHRRSLQDQELPLLVYRRAGATPCSSTLGEGDGGRDYLLSRFRPESQSALFNRPIPRITDLGTGLSNSADHDLFVNGGGPRQKLPSVIYVETAVFVDKDLARHMENYFPRDSEEQLVQVVLAMVNAVQLLYSEGSLGVEVHFVIKRLEILHEDPSGLHRPHDIDIYLTNFCRWQRDENPPGDDHPLHWDHALVLTGLDLYTVTSRGRLNSQVVGLAPVAGMCSSSSSCTVNEGRHFESVYVVAHEIGHNLGMRHDGVTAGNSCDPGEHLMSPTLGSGKISWSTCSRRYLEIFLSSDQSLCLRDAAEATPELDHRGTLLPGQRFPADMQCLLKHGPGSRHADTQALEEICEDLHCRRDHYTWTSHPALEGTTCGALKWCVQGRCLKQSTRTRGSQKIPPSDRRPVTNFFDSRRGESPPIAGIDLLDPEPPVPPLLESVPPSDGPVRFQPDQSGQTPFTRTPDVFGHSGPIASITPVPPSALPPPADGDWSECLSSCLYGTDGMLSSGSIGIQKSHRSCSTCRGQFRYRTCSAVRQCAAGSRRTIQEFADQACRALIVDNPRYSGLATTIPPNGLTQCHVTCDQVASLGPDVSSTWYPDGTTCYRESGAPAYCVSGVCKEFSCNPDSQFVSSGVHCLSAQPVTPVITVETDFWGPWTAGSSCRTSCIAGSRGIELVSRQCLRRESECEGLSKNIRLCSSEVQGCHVRQTVFQHATEVCRRFQREVSQLSGVGMQLSNTPSDPDRACTVACQDLTLHYRFYRVNGREGWFPFGTDCSGGLPGRPKHCLNGKCLDFDVEGIPLQDAVVPAVGARSRSLDLRPVVEDAVEIQPLLPLRSGSSRSTPPPFYSFQEQQVMLHKQLINQHLSEQLPLRKAKTATEGALLRRTQRDVTITSHRLPGSIDSQFLLTLVEQLNHSMTHGNESSKSPLDASKIDLANPIFADVGLNSTHSRVRHRWSVQSPSTVTTEEPDVFLTSTKEPVGDSQENAVENNVSDLVQYETEASEPASDLTDFEFEDLNPPPEELSDLPPEGFWPKKRKDTAMLLHSPDTNEKQKNTSPMTKGGAQKIISITLGRSMDSAMKNEDSLAKSRDSLSGDEENRAPVDDGVWHVRRTPCSVTCGEGLREVIVTCIPAIALTSKSQPKSSPHSPRQNRKISRLPQTDNSKTIYGQPVPFHVDANAFPDAVRKGTRVYHLERGPPTSDRRAPISAKNKDQIHRWYHIIIENPNTEDRSRNDLRRTRPIDTARRNFTRFDFDSARSSLFQDAKRRIANRSQFASLSFTSNSQLMNIVHRKRGRSIDSLTSSVVPKVRCADPMPAVPGFQRCVLRECPLENPKPSPVLSAWLESLVAQSQQA